MPAFPIEPSRRPVEIRDYRAEARENASPSAFALAQWHSFAYECSVFGVRQSMDPERNWISRISWLFLVIIGIGLASYQIESRIAFYFSFPTSTDVSVTLASNVRFPQVTICNENRYRKSVAKNMGIDQLLMQMFPAFYTPANLNNHPNLSILEKFNFTQEQWEELRVNLSQPLRNIFPFGIIWGLVSVGNSPMTPVATDMGLCYAFNVAGFNYTTVAPGASLGLTLIMYTEQEEYLVVNSAAAGFRVLIHDPAEVPLMIQSGFFVAPGFQSSIAFSFENISSPGPPYSECNPDPAYRQANCHIDCVRNYIVDKCNCKINYMPGTDRNCTILEEYRCAQPSIYAYLNHASNALISCSCPDECYSQLYDHSVSMSLFSAEFQTFITTNYNLSSSALLQNIVVVQLFMPTLKYTDVSTTPAYSVMALFSDIGGAMALMLGATLLTVYEILEFVKNLIRDVIIIRKENRDEQMKKRDRGNRKDEVNNESSGTSGLFRLYAHNWSLADRWATMTTPQTNRQDNGIVNKEMNIVNSEQDTVSSELNGETKRYAHKAINRDSEDDKTFGQY